MMVLGALLHSVQAIDAAVRVDGDNHWSCTRVNHVMLGCAAQGLHLGLLVACTDHSHQRNLCQRIELRHVGAVARLHRERGVQVLARQCELHHARFHDKFEVEQGRAISVAPRGRVLSSFCRAQASRPALRKFSAHSFCFET